MFKKIIYKWLPIIFGCHCKKERSFHYKGEQFPVCARCTGEIFGILIGVLLLCFGIIFPFPIYIILALPLIIDGFVQLFTKYESTNLKRVITGAMFGIPFVMLFYAYNEFLKLIAMQIYLYISK